MDIMQALEKAGPELLDRIKVMLDHGYQCKKENDKSYKVWLRNQQVAAASSSCWDAWKEAIQAAKSSA